jgi:hypothetical protein
LLNLALYQYLPLYFPLELKLVYTIILLSPEKSTS